MSKLNNHTEELKDHSLSELLEIRNKIIDEIKTYESSEYYSYEVSYDFCFETYKKNLKS